LRKGAAPELPTLPSPHVIGYLDFIAYLQLTLYKTVISSSLTAVVQRTQVEMATPIIRRACMYGTSTSLKWSFR
jgi:hypothetical protein